MSDTPEEFFDPDDVWRSFLEPVKRMGRDLRAAAATLTDEEVRFMVDAYYARQEDRKRAGGQQRALDASGEPHSVITWLSDQSSTLEKQIKSALDVYTEHHVMGGYMRGVFGMDPYFTREGGSIPVVAGFKRLLGLDTVLMGFGLDSDAIHSPNEKFGLDRFHQGIEASVRFMDAYARQETR